ncbi:MAG: hypothetical protein Q9187_000612 [Circinaria calcarea]
MGRNGRKNWRVMGMMREGENAEEDEKKILGVIIRPPVLAQRPQGIRRFEGRLQGGDGGRGRLPTADPRAKFPAETVGDEDGEGRWPGESESGRR